MDTRIKTQVTRRRWLLAVTAAAVLAAAAVAGAARSPQRAPAPVAVVGLVAERTEAVTLQPGAARAWPAGPGVQAIVAVSGRVAVYGPYGERTVYGPRQGFAAGWEPYWTVNETDSAVELLVTFHTPALERVSSRGAAWGRG